MTYTCPQGHQSTTSDFCDVCGDPITPSPTSTASPDPAAAAAAPAFGPAPTAPVSSLTLDPPAGAAPAVPATAAPTAPTVQKCPSCGGENPADALFCEECGYDFTTGQLPPPPAAMPDPGAAWMAEVWIDPDWFAAQNSPGGCPTSGAPTVVPLRVTSALVGRRSKSRNITPDIDCGGDGAVSHSHAQLTLDHDQWFVEDLGSANGTFVGTPGNPLPTTPLDPHQRHELAADERVYIGGWTRIVLRAATADEKAGLTP